MQIDGLVTQFRKPERFYTNHGSRIRKTYGASYDDKGRIVLEETGTENIYDYIQSFAESVDIHVLLKRFANGDTTALQQRMNGVYGDFTQFPTTYAEILNQVIAGENIFNDLPVETRAKFDHSYSQFLASIGTPEFFDALGVQKPAAEPAEKVEVPDAVKEVESVES